MVVSTKQQLFKATKAGFCGDRFFLWLFIFVIDLKQFFYIFMEWHRKCLIMNVMDNKLVWVKDGNN